MSGGGQALVGKWGQVTYGGGLTNFRRPPPPKKKKKKETRQEGYNILISVLKSPVLKLCLFINSSSEIYMYTSLNYNLMASSTRCIYQTLYTGPGFEMA